MEGPLVPNPDSNDNIINNAQANHNDAPAGQPAPHQCAPNQPSPHQPSPNQPTPANPTGPAMPVANPQPVPIQPAPQIIHQQMKNWCHFKPEFASRPEKDAEAHLLHTNDWMTAHNFEEDVKVQRFCLTLLGEARLWYKSLTPIANNWPALQDNFRRQYSKIGNTPEQIYHQQRSFYFDENTDNVDAYVTKVSQCAAMLNYGEPHISKLLENGIPNRLYPILFPVDNLRDAIATAKRVLTKEKIDRQMSGQSSAIPFIRVSDSNYSFIRASKKGVKFDVMETIKRHSNSIDKLTTLVSKMNIKIDKRDAPYKPQIYLGGPRGQSKN